jgi:large subunit ribosomal protein L10
MADYEIRQKVVDRKQPVVQEISELLKDASSAVLVSYIGIPVDLDTQLRKELREANISYKVFKNSMIRLAAEGTPFEKLAGDLKGSTALAVSKEDATAPARIIDEYSKKAPMLQLKAGVVEGDYYDAEGIVKIAKIPGRNELLSRLLGSLQSPVANFARVIKQIAEKDGEAAPAETAAAAE